MFLWRGIYCVFKCLFYEKCIEKYEMLLIRFRWCSRCWYVSGDFRGVDTFQVMLEVLTGLPAFDENREDQDLVCNIDKPFRWRYSDCVSICRCTKWIILVMMFCFSVQTMSVCQIILKVCHPYLFIYFVIGCTRCNRRCITDNVYVHYIVLQTDYQCHITVIDSTL